MLGAAGLAWGAPAVVGAELGFSRYFSEGMVLQREKPVAVRCFAAPGAEIAVVFAGQRKQVAADGKGRRTVVLEPMPAKDAGETLSATAGAETVSLGNVVVGDVFLFARQTSIDIALGRDAAGRAAAERDAARFRAIRIATVPALKPQDELAGDATRGWAVVDKDEALKLSAAASSRSCRATPGTARWVAPGFDDSAWGETAL